jgi:hypothetical protein
LLARHARAAAVNVHFVAQAVKFIQGIFEDRADLTSHADAEIRKNVSCVDIVTDLKCHPILIRRSTRDQRAFSWCTLSPPGAVGNFVAQSDHPIKSMVNHKHISAMWSKK